MPNFEEFHIAEALRFAGRSKRASKAQLQHANMEVKSKE
jgi:hypothetical protein